MKRLLALILIALLTACTTPPAPAPAPSGPDWQYQGSRSYEREHPGLGVSYRYQSKTGWIDVYVYTLRRGPWAPGVTDPAFASHFQSTVDEVREMGRRGHYADLHIGKVRDVALAGQNFRTVSFRFATDGKPMESVTYLTAMHGKLLKYRITFFAPVSPSAEEIARRFVEQHLREQSQAT